MSEAYTIPYTLTDDVTFPTKKGMQKHLEHELDAWSDFLTFFSKQNTFYQLGQSYRESQVSLTLQNLFELLENRSKFNDFSHSEQIPPPSSSLIGQLILSLHENGNHQNAITVFIWFFFEGSSPYQSRKALEMRISEGQTFIDAAKVVQALPLHAVSHQKLSAAVRTAEAQVESLKKEIKSAQALNAEHDKNLSEKLEEFSEDYQATEDDILSQQDTLFAAHKAQIDLLDEKLAALTDSYKKKLLDFKERVDASEKERQSAELQRVQNHEKYIARLENKLQFDESVALWGTLASEHGDKATKASKWFLGLILGAIVVGLSVPIFAGDQIAASFFVELCLPSGAENCETSREFSARGPLTISALVAATTLIFWLIRLQFKVFLSERHLSLDAAEKKAFAQTYLAMKEGKDINRDGEAIVLAALFRPTQDGIIKDDEASLDISAAAILAKQLSR